MVRGSTAALCALILVGLAYPATAGGTPVTVDTPLGPITGTSENGVDTFLGIRFGNIRERFAVATPVEAWGSTPLDATKFGDYCAQGTAQVPGLHLGMSEDCLFLNIYVPTKRDNSDPLPVGFWIHGGGFTGGTGAEYNGTKLVQEQGMIVVTTNYRLGPLGFMPTDAKGTGGMNGIADQILALRWVHDNIAAFAGAPDAVTVFGESAGSLSTCVIVASPLAKGMLRRAILESGACTGESWGPEVNATAGWAYAGMTIAKLGADSLDDLKNATKFPAASFKWPEVWELPPGVRGSIYFVDYGYVMPRTPREVYTVGDINVEAMIAGHNSFDGLAPWFYPYRSFLPQIFPSTETQYRSNLAVRFGASADAVFKLYNPADAPYNGSVAAAFTRLNGDQHVNCVAKDLIAMVSKHLPGNTYMYSFQHLYAIDKAVEVGMVKPGVNDSHWASHASEISFVFGMDYFYTDPISVVPLTPDEAAMGMQMRDMWGSFIRGGAPKSGNVTWPALTIASGSPAQPAQVQSILKLSTDAGFATTAHVLPSYHDEGCAAMGETW